MRAKENAPSPSLPDRPMTLPSWQGPIAVLGLGVEGRSTLALLRHWGLGPLIALDDKACEAMDGVDWRTGPSAAAGAPEARTVFRSAGVRPDDPRLEQARRAGALVTSQAEAALAVAGRDRLIGITGTLGKGTACTLLRNMLIASGKPVSLAGNIGLPALEAAARLAPEDMLLLELSSFQLSSFTASPRYAAALRTTSEHLDWHRSQREYWDHKGNLVRHQAAGDLCVHHADSPGGRHIGSLGHGRKLAYGTEDRCAAQVSSSWVTWPEFGLRIDADGFGLAGRFNLENLAAAGTLALALGCPAEAVANAARDFRGLPHRFEPLGEVRGRQYINDSYATRPEACQAAVAATAPKPTGLILGGSEKFADFSELARSLATASHLRAIALIGATAERLGGDLEKAWSAAGRKDRIWAQREGLEAALEWLEREVESGAVLLSPACASFGLFSDYKQRGEAFRALVAARASG